MTDAQKRVYVSNLYSGPKWKKKVEKMPMEKVVAIYFDHINDGEVPVHEEEPDHTDPGTIEPSIDRLMERPVSGLGPHHNEDDFQIY